MTVGELARLFRAELGLDLDLTVIPCRGLDRSMLWSETGLPWVLPSPNMPTPDTALVYPGGCLIEGTNLSEGRGTTRPFELWGAPWLDPYRARRGDSIESLTPAAGARASSSGPARSSRRSRSMPAHSAAACRSTSPTRRRSGRPPSTRSRLAVAQTAE